MVYSGKRLFWHYRIQLSFFYKTVSQISFNLFCSGDKRLLSEFLKAEIHGHFNMIILKLTGVFEIHVHFKMIILKRDTFNLKGRHYNWVFKEITKSFVFKYFQKTEVYLEPSQAPKIKPFVKIVNSLRPLTTFTKSSILDI